MKLYLKTALARLRLALVLAFGCGVVFGSNCLDLPAFPDNEADGYVRQTWGNPFGVGIAPELSYFTVDIQAAGGSFNSPTPPVPPGRYATWCFDLQTSIAPGGPGYPTPGTMYAARLYSSCDPQLNTLLPNHPNIIQPQSTWNKVNWLINNRLAACGGVVPTMWEVQHAIYILFGEPHTKPGYPSVRASVVQCLVDSASAHGDFVPSCGQKTAVIFNIEYNWMDEVPDVQVLFIEVPVACLGDRVWNDSIGNDGVQDLGEVGVPGVKVDLYTCADILMGSTVTDANGLYQFHVPGGNYYVRFSNLPANYVFSPSTASTASDATDSDANTSTGKTDCTNLAAAESDQTWDAGIYYVPPPPEPAALGDFVWNDVNADGIQDGTEPGIPGVLVSLYDCNDNLISTQPTDAFGKYLFTGLTPGGYYVVFANVPGFGRSPQDAGSDDAKDSDANGIGQTICYTLGSGETNLTVDAGYFKLAELGDFVWHDVNANGLQDDGPTGIANVPVQLLDQIGNVIDSTVTDVNGYYLFDNLFPGTYAVRFPELPCYARSPQDQGGDDSMDSDADLLTGKTVNVTLIPGDSNLTLDAGYFKPYLVGSLTGCYKSEAEALSAAQAATSWSLPGFPYGFSATRTGADCDAVITMAANAPCANIAPLIYHVSIYPTKPVFSGLPTPIVEVQCIRDVPPLASVTATDSCGQALVPALNELPPVGDDCNKEITRIWTVSDCAGNSETFTQVIKVKDTTPPTLVGMPSDTTVECDAIPAPADVTATDNCGPNPTVTMTQTPAVPPIGCQSYDIVRTWTATDACGNPVSASQTIHVKDTTAPLLVGVPSNTTVECDAIPAPAEVTATDNCGPNPTVTMTQTPAVPPVGCQTYDIVRTWTAMDACGNPVSASQTIHVKDTTAPVLVGVPANITVECGAIPVPATVTATDNCGPNPTVTMTETPAVPGTCEYDIVRTWTATDTCGNPVSASQTIHVKDSTAPVIGSAGPSKTIACDETPVFTPPTATDCTPNPSIIEVSDVTTQNPDGGYSRTKTWKAVDACGNESATVSQTITVPSQSCTPASFNLSGGSNSGGNPNYRTFISDNGVTAKVTGWSRMSSGVWNAAYVGSYSGGLGVTDTSEDGSNPSHTVDNVGRLNFLVFEFSQPVAPTSASLGYVVTDSDITLAVGTLGGPLGTPNDGTFTGFFVENNDTTSSSARTVDFNAGKVTGNVLVIAASLTDTTPDDYFKVQALGICVPGCFQPVKVGDFVWNDLDQDGIQDAGEPGINGVKLTLTGTKQSGGSVNLTTTTAGNGGYLFDGLEPGTYTVTVDASNFASGGALQGWTASPTGQGTTATDSNPSPTGTSPALLPGGSQDLRLDFGYYFVPPPPPCVESTFYFSGSTGTSGTAGNIRTYTAGGVTVNVSGFSRTSAGAWDAGYLGAYSGGLGVTDTGEGDGSSNKHTVDNVDRINYVLFEFSQPVVVSKAYLGYVVTDSDVSAWVGNIPGAFANHLNLNNAVLSQLAVEHNDTTSSSARWVPLNAGEVAGNVLVIAASITDATPDDYFKIAKLTVCAPSNPPVETASIGDRVWKDSNGNGVQDSGEAGVGGVTVKLYRCLDDALIGTTTTSSSGIYGFTTVPGDYYVKFTLPSGYTFSPANVGNDATDSDANTSTGVAACTTLVAGENDTTWDAGLVQPPPPPTADCVPTTYDFSGSSALDGSNGNIRTYTVNGISVKASAFSRDPSNGSWATAWLGAYGGGLGVTDSGEGDGSSNKHTVDNVGRINYVLFEFSQPVVVNRAYLGYVVTDSDISVWVGSVNNVYNNHQTLSDGLLSSLGSPEHNDTTSSSARWAAFNGSEKVGNVLVIAASTSDSTPDDYFKIEKLDICANNEPPCPSPWNSKDIGSCIKAGSDSYSSGLFTVKGSGDDIWNCADSFRYVYQQASGDCKIVARVKSVGNTNPWAKAGVMIRETLNTGSEHASVFVTPSNGVAFQYRDSTGGSSGNSNDTGLSAPYWVMIERVGNTLKAYRSATGASGSWVLMGTKTIYMGTSVYIGLAVTSHDDSLLSTSTFDNVTATP